ncbi:MAG: metal-dependent transcriptional regulator [Proteobacteria bacterium]|nr:metal-dependent transcriptional regulator [Pseudomonadota bacterium]
MQRSHEIEEVLETLWIRSQEKNEQSIDCMALHLKDASILGEMKEQALVMVKNGIVGLTAKGLAELLLTDIIDVKSDALVHETACGFEHLLRKGIDDKICTLLGHPGQCPHGKPIPPGKCCSQKDKQAGQVLPLSSLESEQKGKVSYLHTRDSKELKKLMAMGLLPGTPVTLIQSFPSYVFRLGYTQFAVDKKIADEIYVKLS